jgi:hypothetical protein
LRQTNFLFLRLIAGSLKEPEGLDTRPVVGFALCGSLPREFPLLHQLPLALLVLGLETRCWRLRGL